MNFFEFILYLELLINLNVQSHKYKYYNIEDDDICSLITTRTLQLGNDDDSYQMIKQSRLNDHSLDWTLDYECTFKVAWDGSHEGVFAVIQQLEMRRNKTTKNCIDYVEFSARDGAARSNKFCGKINATAAMTNTDHILDNINFGNSFRTKKHKMHVHIFVDRRALKRNERVDLEIVFTAYKNCTKIRNDRYLPCSKHSQFCIHRELFNDSIVNCPFSGCVDEGDCSQLQIYQNPSVTTRLLVGSLSFLLVLFVCFLMCVWACKKHKVVCFSEDFSNPSRRTPCPRYEMSEQTGSRLAQDNETTSPENTESTDLSKDLPPSYDTLFPDR